MNKKHIVAFLGITLVLIGGFYIYKYNTPEVSLNTGEAAIMAPILVGDLNNDGIVNSLDWSIMSTKWFTTDAAADLNHDGFVNSIDFSLLNNNWFRTTKPTVVYADTFPGADASAKINAAIASLPLATGGVVDATRLVGNQTLSSAIQIHKKIHLKLGANTFTFTGTGDKYRSYAIYALTDPASLSNADGSIIEGVSRTRTVIKTTGVFSGIGMAASNMKVTNLTLEGTGEGFGTAEGLAAGNQHDNEISNVTVRNFGSNGMNSGGNNLRFVIKDSLFDGNGADGVLLAHGSSYSYITNSTFINNGSNGIDTNGSNNEFSGNRLSHNGYKINYGTDNLGILITALSATVPANNNIVKNNIIEDTSGQGIVIRSFDGSETNGNRIENNTISGSTAPNGDGIAIDGTGGGRIENNIVTGNTVSGQARYGILIDGTYSQGVKNNIISGNTVSLSGSNGIAVVSAPTNQSLANNNSVINNAVSGSGAAPQINIWPNTNTISSGNTINIVQTN